MSEDLIGFFLRSTIAEEWSNERRVNHLLNEQVKVPLSVDERVWLACDNENLYTLLFSNFLRCSEGFCSSNGLSIYYIKDIVFLQRPSMQGAGFLIGVTVCNETYDRLNKFKKMHDIVNSPYNVEHLLEYGWTCLGYDVANEWMLSGLIVSFPIL